MDTSLVIDRLGGTAKTARICKVSRSAVSQWKRSGIPKPWMAYLKARYPSVFEIPAQPWESGAVCRDEEVSP